MNEFKRLVTARAKRLHDLMLKFPIYAALNVPEVWRFDGREVSIHLLKQDEYVHVAERRALPMLTGRVLTDSITHLRERGELQVLLSLDEWLKESFLIPTRAVSG